MKNALRMILPAVCLFSLAMAADAAATASSGEARTLSGYHIGNSLIRSITMDRLHALMAERGIDYQFGSQLGAGTSLKRHWERGQGGKKFKLNKWETNKPAGDTFDPAGPDRNPYPVRFGHYDNALVNCKFDALILQPYDGQMKDDREAIKNFIDLTLANKSADQIYLYQTWCRRMPAKDASGKKVGIEPIDYAKQWDTRKYGSKGFYWDTFRTRDYHQKLLKNVNADFKGKLANPVRVIPAGDVFYEMDQRLKAGKIPGLAELYARNPKMIPGWDPAIGAKAGANILYADRIHPNPIPHLTGNISNYLVGMTNFAVLAGQSPIGLSGKAYGLDDEKDAELIKALQQVVWDVVSANPDTGVKADK